VLPVLLTAEENEASFAVDGRPDSVGSTLRAHPTPLPVLPTVVLVQNGRIVWRGHRDDVDLEASVEALLAGDGVVV
jgi:hypothetical protein